MRLGSLLGLFASAAFVVGCSQTDAGITTSVQAKLAADDLVKARQIDVDTADHVVTLNGTVQSSEEEAQALQIARNTKGVNSVIDNIDVQGGMEGSAPTSGSADSMSSMGADSSMSSAADDEIEAKVKSAIAADNALKDQQIAVEANAGVVTMSGTVDTQAVKTKAAEVAGKVDGVSRVDDKLTVSTK
jgi:hyperosmotically inducible periplasmic protein